MWRYIFITIKYIFLPDLYKGRKIPSKRREMTKDGMKHECGRVLRTLFRSYRKLGCTFDLKDSERRIMG